MMVICDTLVYDSENWSIDQPFPVVSLVFSLGPSFILRSCHIRDKDVLTKFNLAILGWGAVRIHQLNWV